jgi:hypothetical protein
LTKSNCEEDCHLNPASILAGAFNLPAIQSLPPIKDSMSLDCIVGYKLLDFFGKMIAG